MDLGVGVFDRGPQGVRRGAIREFLIRQRHDIDRQLAGQFAGGMGSHPVGHHVQIPSLLKSRHAAGNSHSRRILIVGPPQPDIRGGCVFYAVFPNCRVNVHYGERQVKAVGGISSTTSNEPAL